MGIQTDGQLENIIPQLSPAWRHENKQTNKQTNKQQAGPVTLFETLKATYRED